MGLQMGSLFLFSQKHCVALTPACPEDYTIILQQTQSTEAIEALRLQLFETQLSHSHANPSCIDAIGKE